MINPKREENRRRREGDSAGLGAEVVPMGCAVPPLLPPAVFDQITAGTIRCAACAPRVLLVLLVWTCTVGGESAPPSSLHLLTYAILLPY